jgi:phosphonate transport system substrate-binding protein
MPRTGVLLTALVFGWISPVTLAADAPNATRGAASPLRVAFSPSVVGQINHNDAKASMIAWGKSILASGEYGYAGIEPIILERSGRLLDLLQAAEIDAAVVQTNEYVTRPATLTLESVYVGLQNGKTTLQYVLLVHQASSITSLAGLKGRSLALHTSTATSLAGPWLDLLFHEAGLGLTEAVFSKIEFPDKASRAVMRVFFRQADAVLVTRTAFETMHELNPQLRKDLRVLASSPELITSFLILRPGFIDTVGQNFERALLNVHETVAGRQAMTVFLTEKLEKHPVSILQPTVDFLAAATRLRPKATLPGGESVVEATRAER